MSAQQIKWPNLAEVEERMAANIVRALDAQQLKDCRGRIYPII